MIISLLIAAYNVEKHIKKCLLSCVLQDLPSEKFEIICVNDGSTDQTATIIKEIQLSYRNIILIEQANSGLGSARNKALHHASGSFVWFIDGDDFIEPMVLSKIIFSLKNLNLDILMLNYKIVDEQGTVINNNANNPDVTEVISGSEFYKNNYSKSYTWSFVFERILFYKNRIFFKERINMQDSEILPKLMFHSKRISFLNVRCYNYVQHPNSFTNSKNGKNRYIYFASIIKVKKSLQHFLDNDVGNDEQIRVGLKKKIESLHDVIFNHLVYFRYEKTWAIKIIDLLQKNRLYPLQVDCKGKMKLIKWGLNHYPLTVLGLIDFIRNFKNKF
ncbi:glycosyltransferase [Aequorivita sp. SDUM287046]|uniref:Glycosyltransferase n=1 Tax=Aequorivita aurantiaca TaxID=3053356 RepID=A0ABT8DLN0_9FLAO|nr:glycosyltransferase [Aequorivita aurantiaca]MDN3723967.1 glycosyltransferase [Aequorivita aurantiaca]